MMDDYKNSPTIKFFADIFPAHRFPSIKLFLKQIIALIIFLKNDWNTSMNCQMVRP